MGKILKETLAPTSIFVHRRNYWNSRCFLIEKYGVQCLMTSRNICCGINTTPTDISMNQGLTTQLLKTKRRRIYCTVSRYAFTILRCTETGGTWRMKSRTIHRYRCSRVAHHCFTHTYQMFPALWPFQAAHWKIPALWSGGIFCPGFCLGGDEL